MMRLNLMPWRERQRLAALRRLRLMLLGSAILALCAVLLMDQLARDRAQRQAVGNAALQVAVAGLDEQLEQFEPVNQAYESVRAQIAAVAALRADQGIVVNLLADLERALPEGIQLTELKLERSRLHIGGLAASGAVVAQFMRDLERAGSLLDLELKRVQSTAGGEAFLLAARMSADWS
ncbi:PilN domain-containing protein [Pseudomonas sp. KU43P]|uniref:PilN domain-containing protein n=1 Tax=Pseudomonas sp. KU43P TaxID=2487887 RepID=UPI0012A9C9E0|nr:PilN domain-containing protein [Pseudomonas sp. KU43P]BBH43826.1 pilus assembly protein PilN [Pseudomonas sp. KU43P]